jgi:hypothetical protein
LLRIKLILIGLLPKIPQNSFFQPAVVPHPSFPGLVLVPNNLLFLKFRAFGEQ